VDDPHVFELEQAVKAILAERGETEEESLAA
jgi:hypothetical protein